VTKAVFVIEGKLKAINNLLYSYEMRFFIISFLALSNVLLIHVMCFHLTEISQNLLELIINCSITPDIWCRLQFSGDCFCVPHNNSDFSENANCTQFSNHSFSGNSISLHVNRSEFHKTFAGSFIEHSILQVSIYVHNLRFIKVT